MLNTKTRHPLRHMLRTLIVLTLACSSAHAGIISTFSDKSTFLGISGAGSITGAIPNTGNVGSSETLGDVTFSTAAFSTTTDIFFGGNNWSTLISGNEIALSGSENLDIAINLGHSVTSFGFDFHEPSATGQLTDGTNTPHFHDSSFTIELFDGATLVDTTVFDPANDTLLFFGLTTDSGFDSVRITEDLAGITYSGGIDISNDNEFFGEFYAAPVTTVPEPGMLVLFAVGLAGLALRQSRLSR